MPTIHTHYHVTDRTMAFAPAFHTDYDTIVYERGRQVFVRQTPLQLIKAACLEDYATYEGRRFAVSYQIGAKRKVPIPINPIKNIYAFPTLSPQESNCHWIFYHHVKKAQAHNDKQHPNIKSMLTFKDGQQIKLEQSYYVLEKQMNRTATIIVQYASFQHTFTTN